MGLSHSAHTSELPIILCLYVPITTLPHGLGSLAPLGPRGSERRKQLGSFDRCCFQFLCISPSFYFSNLSLDSANCRNFSPSGWQPLPGGAW